MKANELMVNDLVLFRGEIHKVQEIYGIGGNVYLNDYGTIETIKLLPIPLTLEILDKNFKNIAEPHQMIYGGRWVIHNEFFEVEITEYTDGLWQVQVDEIEMSGLPTWRMYVSNVHELQQALRLANVKKEII